MSRQEALRNDLKALEWLRDHLNARWNEARGAGETSPREGSGETRDLERVNEVEYADPRRIYRN